MAAFDKSNVVIGPAQLYIAPAATALPDLTNLITNSNGDQDVDWTGYSPLGFTDGGWAWKYTPTFKDIKVDELSTPVKKLLTDEALSVTGKGAEMLIDNLNKVITGSTVETLTETTTLYVGGKDPNNITEYVLGISGHAPGTNQRRILLAYRVISIAAVEVAQSRLDKQMYDVEFFALADTTKAVGKQLFQLTDFLVGAS